MNKDLKKPENLNEYGIKAYDTILRVLTEKEATQTGGCKAFYSPEEWEERGEEYGQEAELIVVYDGGDLARFFSLDHAWPTYKMHTLMSEALAEAGFYAEECTGWYSAIYKV